MTNPFVFDPNAPVLGGTDYGHPFPGVHQARFMGAVDVGLQPNNSVLYGDKSPSKKIVLFYELLDDTVEVDGVVTNRRFSTTVTARMTKNSNIRKHITALDPENTFGGDLTKLVGTPVSLILELYSRQDGTQGCKFSGIATVPQQQAATFPPATLEPVFFTPLRPDPEQWKKLPRFVREMVCSALDFAETPAAQQGYKADIPQEQAVQPNTPTPQQSQQVSFGGQVVDAPAAPQQVPQPQQQVPQAPQQASVGAHAVGSPQSQVAPQQAQQPAPAQQQPAGGMVPPPPPPPTGG